MPLRHRHPPISTTPPGERLSELEIALGYPVGIDRSAPPLPPVHSDLTPVGALEDVLRRCLSHPPCVVKFSGGRDSSVLLALAMRVARRDGLDFPIAVTHRFPAHPETEESDWQERVIRHVGVSDWERIEFEDELDFLGPIATETMRRLGHYWPPNAHAHTPDLLRARNGTVVTGAFGDEVFIQVPRIARLRRVLTREIPFELRDAARIGVFLLPRSIRRPVEAKRHLDPTQIPAWLTPVAGRAAESRLASELARRPLRWDREIQWWWRQRLTQVSLGSLQHLAREYTTTVVAPFADPAFLGALINWGGAWTASDRSETLRSLFSEVLPLQVLHRKSKATFDGVFWNVHSRRFAKAWDGHGLDRSLVNPEALRSAWLGDQPGPLSPSGHTFASATALQSAWARTVARSGS